MTMSVHLVPPSFLPLADHAPRTRAEVAYQRLWRAMEETTNPAGPNGPARPAGAWPAVSPQGRPALDEAAGRAVQAK